MGDEIQREDIRYRVVLDLQACQTEGSRNRGIGRYSRSLSEAMVRGHRDLDFTIALNDVYPEAGRKLEDEFASMVGDEKCVRYAATAPEAAWSAREPDFGRLAGEWLVENAWLAQKPDLIHVSSLFEGFHGKAVVPTLIGLPQTTVMSATAYDLIPLIFSDIYLADKRTREWYHSCIARLRRCDVLLAISEATRQDLVARLGIAPERIANIRGAADVRFSPGSVAPERRATLLAKFGIVGPYVMYTGGIDHRKNIEALIRAYAGLPPAMRDAHQLAIVCGVQEIERARLQELARQCRLPDRTLVLTGFVADDDLVDLCRCCHLFAFPSQYEGFGLPVLEAMSCGAPTIAASTSSLPEIVGRADALFGVGSDEEIGAALHHALADDGFRRELALHGLVQSRQFSWSATAARAREAWDDAIARKSERVAVALSASRPRLALVTPLLPERSGIADFVTELLPHLAHHFEIDLFATDGADADRYRKAGFSVHAWQQLPGSWRDYDAGVVYQFGNSDFHAHMLALLDACPGTVMLHDAYLSGLMSYMEHGPPAISGFFRHMLEYAHAGSGIAHCDRLGIESTVDRFPMSRWVADHANGLIVTSQHARSILVEHGQLGTARCAVVPHHRTAQPISMQQRIAARTALGIAGETMLVTSLGFVHPRKCSLDLVDAWLRLTNLANARLVFVGEAVPKHRNVLRERAAGSSRESEIAITGYVSDEDFHRYIHASDIVVQLRRGSRGEASGAMLYAMACGVPVIASRHGSLAETAEDACVHVSDPVDPAELADGITLLAQDSGRREALGRRAIEWIRETRDPKRIALELAIAIRRFNDPSAVHRQATFATRVATATERMPTSTRGRWLSDVRERAATAAPARFHGDAAMEIGQSLARLLPSYRPYQVSPPVGTEKLEWGRAMTLFADDPRLFTKCGVKDDGTIRTTGSAGLLLYGPYIDVAPGRYRVQVYGAGMPDGAAHPALLEATAGAGGKYLASSPMMGVGVRLGGLGAESENGLGSIEFESTDPIRQFEIRIRVPEGLQMTIESIDIVPTMPGSTAD